MGKAEELSLNRYSTLAEKFAFIDGYEEAEKNLALTWEDIESIHTLMAHQEVVPILWKCGNEAFYQEVLNRFKKGKG